jgi:AcrR family transcriptional regulator
VQAKGRKEPQQPGRRQGKTFTEIARRAQIVQAAIEVLAEVGYAKTSFAKIARRAGLSSTGLISYHFAGKDDLMREVLAQAWEVADGYVRPRVEAQVTATARLRAYIESYMALMSEFPHHLSAISEVLGNTEGSAEYTGSVDAVLDFQQGRMREAQQSGEFRPFNTRVMVLAVRGALNELIDHAGKEPDLDLISCGRELADIFERATSAER